MGISTFPAPSTGGGETNDFILDKNGTTNTTFSPGRSFAAGGYSVVVTGSTAYDLYLLDSNGSSVGYTNGTSIVASAAFEKVSALGLGTADVVAFTYNGPSTNASSAGDETGAGPYLTSISPSDLPQIDDTAIVAGGNFASDVEVSFISGTVTKAAKNVVVGSSTALVVTRPDDLIEDLAPYDLKAVNPGITQPTGSNANILAGTVTAGTDPSFVTTSPILGAQLSTAFSSAIQVSDTEGTVVNWQITAGSLPTGLALATATGTISGTPTAEGEYTFTVQITDDGNNTNSQEFIMPVGLYVTGGSTAVSGGTTYHSFETSGDLTILNVAGTANIEYLVIAGGGGGGSTGTNSAGGGGGAGGLLHGTAAITAGTTWTISVGAGGASMANGANSEWPAYATAIGGGRGGTGGNNGPGQPGGSGGGGGSGSGAGGTGTVGQGTNGYQGHYPGSNAGGGGGGAGTAPTDINGGFGIDFGAWATAIGLAYNTFAGGGGGGQSAGSPGSGRDGGGNGARGANSNSSPGVNGRGGGGGGGADYNGDNRGPSAGGAGRVIVRYS